jgi:hypothetical protein
MRILLLMLIFIVGSCAMNRARKNIAYSDISINGGVYNNKDWRDKLSFKRTSWFREASMDYDILFHKLDKTSSFASWMGSDQKYLTDCHEFYVALVYADINAPNGTPFLVNQIDSIGVKKVGIQDFKENLKAHENFRDWRLTQHKVVGFCRPESLKEDIVISIPGFKSVKL